MAVSYKKLWHLLIDKDMKKKDLEAAAGINHYTMNISDFIISQNNYLMEDNYE